MSKFKVGDKVRRIKRSANSCGVLMGHKDRVTKVTRDGGIYIENGLDYDYNQDHFELVEEPWTPKNGEMIEVRLFCSPECWKERKFIGMNGNSAVCVDTDGRYHGWKNYRKIQKTHTITIDNETAEISEESLKELKKLLSKL